ncbi:MAG TPA: hypothetical protein VGK67_19920 [Myxococcales bacterium]|jgi:hypothetical protein
MPAVTFADHEGFQKTVLRASAGGAAAGLAMYGLASLPYPLAIPDEFTLLPFVCAASAAAACGKTWKGRLAYGLLGGFAGLLPWLAGAHPTFWLAAAGASVGSMFAHFRQKESGKEISVGKSRMGKASYVAAAALSAVAILAGRAVVEAFTTRGLLEGLLPAPLIAMTITALLAFFMSLGSAGAHVAQDPDPVEKLYAVMQPELTGDLKQLAGRAMTNYRRCAEILANSEPGFARQQLNKSLNEVTLRILELGRRWQNIDRELGERAETEINQRLAELRKLKESLKDESAKRQLGGAEAAVMAELQQLGRIRAGRERVVARLHGEMAVLDRTRLSLLSLKTSDAHLRAAELSALSDSLSSVAREMDCEAEAVDEIISKVVDPSRDVSSPPAKAEPVMEKIAEIQAPAAAEAAVASPAPTEKAKA